MRATGRICLAGVILAIAQPGVADEIGDFYKGKTVSIVVGHQSGTGFDVYARVLQRHIGRHIPGNPAVIVQNMIGAGGITAANWLANVAPKDGTVMGSFVHTVAFERLFGNDKAKYDPAKLNWIGNMEESTALCGVSKASGIGSFDDLQKKETLIGAAAATGALGKYAQAVKKLAGARLKVVYGYKGATDIKLAMDRGEVQGICGLSMSTLKSSWGDVYKSGEFRPVIQLSGKPHPELKGLPHVDRHAKTEEDKQVFGLIFGALALGRIYASPPGQPPERTEALRTALMETLRDKEFLADAAKTKIEIQPMTGAEVEALIAKFSAVPPAVVERARRATSRD